MSVRVSEVGQHLGQDFQKRGLMVVHRDHAVGHAPIPAQCLNHVQVGELGDDLPGRDLPSGLAYLPLQHAVGE